MLLDGGGRPGEAGFQPSANPGVWPPGPFLSTAESPCTAECVPGTQRLLQPHPPCVHHALTHQTTGNKRNFATACDSGMQLWYSDMPPMQKTAAESVPGLCLRLRHPRIFCIARDQSHLHMIEVLPMNSVAHYLLLCAKACKFSVGLCLIPLSCTCHALHSAIAATQRYCLIMRKDPRQALPLSCTIFKAMSGIVANVACAQDKTE